MSVGPACVRTPSVPARTANELATVASTSGSVASQSRVYIPPGISHRWKACAEIMMGALKIVVSRSVYNLYVIVEII